MNQILTEKTQTALFFRIIACFFIVNYFVWPGLYKDFVYLVSIFCIIGFFFGFKIDLRFSRLFSISLLFFVLPDIINMARGYSSVSDIEKISRNVLLVLPVGAILYYRNISNDLLVKAIVLMFFYTLFFLFLQEEGIFASQSEHYDGEYPGLWYNKGTFSTAVVFFYSLLAGMFFVPLRKTPFGWLLSGFVAVSVILVMTEARGPILAFTIINIIMVFIHYRYNLKSLTNFKMLSFFALVILLVIYFLLWDRINLAYIEASNYLVAGDISFDNSIAVRIESWRLAWDVFLRNPIFGYGVKEALEVKKEILASGNYPDYMLSFHTHSEYFYMLERGGIFGLICLFLFVLFPFYILRYYGVSLVEAAPTFFVTVSFLVIGLTSATLRNNLGANSYLLCLALSMAYSIISANGKMKNEIAS